MNALLRLFKAVEIKEKRKKKPAKKVLSETIKYGFIFSPEVNYNYSEDDLIKLTSQIKNEIGIAPEQLNSSFHKSWSKIKDAPIAQLVFEQIIHYFTTYGFECLNIYDESSVYIPNERLEIPELDIDGFDFVIIKGYKKEEIEQKVSDLLKSGIAFKEDTIKDLVEIIKHFKINIDVDKIKNKEIKIALCDHFKLFPHNPTEFLRYLIYKTTSRTLLIKNQETIEGIKSSLSPFISPFGERATPYNDNQIYLLFNNYIKKYGYHRLAEIFFRFKPLFLAFRSDPEIKPIINKIRKLADKYHKPMSRDYLNDITGLIKNGISIDKNKLQKSLNEVNTFRKIRLAYALKYRTKDVDSILYKIRNGKSFAKGFSFNNRPKADEVLKIVLRSIIADLKTKVDGKKIFIPDFIVYALPATEKQFTGYFPSGTYIQIPKDMIFGIHWKNVNEIRVDLDLSLINTETGKIGWDSRYRTDERSIMFSGDMTDAPEKKGATELFYIGKRLKLESIVMVNYFNFQPEVEIPFKILVAEEQASNFNKNHMVDPNNLKGVAYTKINEKQKILGLIIATTKNCRFYFSETSIGRSITSGNQEYIKHSRKYLMNFYQNSIDLNELLIQSGATLVQDKESCDVDLSPENLEKDTIINLIL